ncbi:hypothetical protein Hdeb2414_s0003g00107191 [Helianthus debilis subsp. tardiflorus]
MDADDSLHSRPLLHQMMSHGETENLLCWNVDEDFSIVGMLTKTNMHTFCSLTRISLSAEVTL